MSKFSFLKILKLRDILFFGFMVVYVLNISQLYFLYSNTIKLNNVIQEEFARLDNKSLIQTLNSDNNKDVFLKSRLLKRVDEVVISTSEVENTNLKVVKDQYYKFYTDTSKPNWLVWFDCYFGSKEYKSTCFK
jgi:hypothetical protein